MAVALAAAGLHRRPRPFAVTALGIAGLWALLDLNRWQPYVAFYVVALGCFAVRSPPVSGPRSRGPGTLSMAPFQLFVCCMYVYSGLQKLNRHYVTADFRRTAAPVLHLAGVDFTALPHLLVLGLALSSALLEAAFGAMLLATRMRRAGVVGLTLTHVYVLLAIGPLGLNYNSVVWPWNVAAVAALWLLFWPSAASAAFSQALASTDWRLWRMRRGSRYWNAVLLVFGMLPATSFFGGWVAGLSFEMYAGRQPLVWVLFDPAHADALPPSFRRANDGGMVNLQEWALDDLNASPALDRYAVLRVGQAIAQRAPLANIRLLIAGSPATFSGRRQTGYYEFRGAGMEPVDVSDQHTIRLPPEN